MKFYSLLFLLLISQALHAQVKYTGKVLDSESKKPIPFVNISVEGTSQGTCTDINGKFDFISSKKRLVILISSLGFETDTPKLKKSFNKILLHPISYQLDGVSISGKKRFNLKRIVRRALGDLKDDREKDCLSSFELIRNIEENGVVKFRETVKIDVSFNSDFKYLRGENEYAHVVRDSLKTVDKSFKNHIFHNSRHSLKYLYCFSNDLSHHKDLLYNSNKFSYKLKELSNSKIVIECLQSKDTLLVLPHSTLLWKRSRILSINRISMKINNIEGVDYLYDDDGFSIMVYNKHFNTSYMYKDGVASISKINVIASNYTYIHSTKKELKTFYHDEINRISN